MCLNIIEKYSQKYFSIYACYSQINKRIFALIFRKRQIQYIMGKSELIALVENSVEIKKFPAFKAGDTITVTYKIKEGSKERLQSFQGVVIQRKGGGPTETFTIRKISGGVGVERIFPIASPNIEEIKIMRKGAVRRARIFYIRSLRGKKARIKEKRG